MITFLALWTEVIGIIFLIKFTIYCQGPEGRLLGLTRRSLARSFTLVFTKSVNSNFRVFRLAPVTVLRQDPLMASRFETFSEDEICMINEAFVQTNTKKATNLVCRCSLVGRKLFSYWICNKIVKCIGQNPRNVRKLWTKSLPSDVCNLQKFTFFSFIQLVW